MPDDDGAAPPIRPFPSLFPSASAPTLGPSRPRSPYPALNAELAVYDSRKRERTAPPLEDIPEPKRPCILFDEFGSSQPGPTTLTVTASTKEDVKPTLASPFSTRRTQPKEGRIREDTPATTTASHPSLSLGRAPAPGPRRMPDPPQATMQQMVARRLAQTTGTLSAAPILNLDQGDSDIKPVAPFPDSSMDSIVENDENVSPSIHMSSSRSLSPILRLPLSPIEVVDPSFADVPLPLDLLIPLAPPGYPTSLSQTRPAGERTYSRRSRKPTPFLQSDGEEDPEKQDNFDSEEDSDNDGRSLIGDDTSDVESDLSCTCRNCRWRRGDLPATDVPFASMDEDAERDYGSRGISPESDSGSVLPEEGLPSVLIGMPTTFRRAISGTRPPSACPSRVADSLIEDTTMVADEGPQVNAQARAKRSTAAAIVQDTQDEDGVPKADAAPAQSGILETRESSQADVRRAMPSASVSSSRATSPTLTSNSTGEVSVPRKPSSSASAPAEPRSAMAPSAAKNKPAVIHNPVSEPVPSNTSANQDVMKLLTSLNESVAAQTTSQAVFVTSTTKQLNDLSSTVKRLAERQDAQAAAEERLRLKIGRIGTTLERFVALADKLSSDQTSSTSDKLVATMASLKDVADTHRAALNNHRNIGPQLDGMDEALLVLEQKMLGIGMFLTGRVVRNPDSVVQNGLQAQFDILNNRLNNQDETLEEIKGGMPYEYEEFRDVTNRISELENAIGNGPGAPPAESVLGQLKAIQQRLERNFKY